MATIAEFTVPSSGFPLGRVFESLLDVTVEIERVIPVRSRILPYFWVRGADAETVSDVLAATTVLENATLVDQVDDQSLFRAEWTADMNGLLSWFATANATLLNAVGTATEWAFEIRAESPDVLSSFQQYCTDNDIPVTLQRFRSLADSIDGDDYHLTPEQEEALLLAFDAGYYSEPRETTLEELADSLGITRQSLSSRLRRGYRNLIAATISDRRA